MPDFNLTDYVNDDGSFTESGIASLAGDEHAGTKAFDDIPNFQTLVKVYADTKRKVGEKHENVIQRPAENATDDQRAEFRKLLLKELGAVEKSEDFGFEVPTLPEGMVYDKATDDFYKDLFIKLNLPKDIATELRSAFIEASIKRHNDRIKAENEAFENSVKQFKERHKGDDEVLHVRYAHDALMHFAGDDIVKDGQTIKGLKTLIKEANLYSNPTEYEKWKDLGIKPDQIELWGNIGNRMKSGFTARDEGGGTDKTKENTPQQLGETMYRHPTSQRELLGKK